MGLFMASAEVMKTCKRTSERNPFVGHIASNCVARPVIFAEATGAIKVGEIFEIIVGRQLGCHAKPIVLLNIARYYDPLLALLDHGIEQQFIKPAGRELIHVAASVVEAIDYLRSAAAPPPPASPEPSSALE